MLQITLIQVNYKLHMTAPNNKTTNILFTLRKKYTYLKLHCGNSRQRILFARIEYCSPACHAHEQSFVVLDKKL